MSKANNLKNKVNSIESKASDYETANNFEAKKQKYLNGLSEIETSLGGVDSRLERMEFLCVVLLEILESRKSVPPEVREARESASALVDYDAEYYYELVDEQETDQYEHRVQQTKSNLQKAIQTLESELRDEEDEWLKRVESARSVQRLFGDSMDITPTLSKIETFVKHRMGDESESITALAADWQALKKNWEQQGADWDTFQAEYNLSDRTIDLLQELATGDDVELGRLDKKTISEFMSVDDLQDVAKLTI